MDVVRRVQAVLFRPKREWARIKAEPATVAGLFVPYVLVLAAVSPAAKFAGRMIFRSEIPFARVPAWSVGRALSNALLSYALSLALVYLSGVIVNALAQSFSSKQSLTSSMKLAVYSMTPVWLAGVLAVVPELGDAALLAGLYGAYLFHAGLRASVLDTPRNRVLPFFIVGVVAIAALFAVFGLILWVLYFRRMA